MGQEVSFPVLISPPGCKPCTPRARWRWPGGRGRGTAMGLSSSPASRSKRSRRPARRLLPVTGSGTRGPDRGQRMERARHAGRSASSATLDWSFSHGRDWGSPVIPESMNLRTMLRFGPQALASPALVPLLRARRQAARPDDAQHGAAGRAGADFRCLRPVDADASPSWDDVAWLRDQWDGPFMLKGVIRVDDAKRAVDAGASAISVSEPRRQQPRRDAGHDPRPARDRSSGRRPGRGPARRRRPARQRRRQGGGARSRAVMIGRAYSGDWRPTGRPESRTSGHRPRRH